MNVAPAMGLLTVDFHLEGCRSLKERRGRLSGLRDRFGRNARIALCEHASDDPGASRWSFLAMAGDDRAVDELLASIERDLESRVDAVVTDLWRERL